jgi:hypothetical protein
MAGPAWGDEAYGEPGVSDQREPFQNAEWLFDDQKDAWQKLAKWRER